MRIIIHLCLFIVLTGCTSTKIKQNEQTNECKEYNLMLTAPMPQHALLNLQKKCLDSNK